MLLIFDCDGTLVDSEGIANQVFIDAIHQLGIPLSEEEAWQHFPGTSMALCIQYVEKTYEVTLPDDFIPRQRVKQKLAFASQLQPIEGAKQALDGLAQRKCVASNGPHEVTLTNLKTTKLLPYFDDKIFSAYLIEKWKPLPDLFEHAAATFGVHAEDCIVIEDSLPGMKAGLNAGMQVLGYRPHGAKYQVDLEGVITFDDMHKLPDLIAEFVK